MGVPQRYDPAHPLELLRPHPRNYRTHPPDQLTHLAASLTELGVYRNVVATESGVILAGHGVVEAARSLGWETLPVMVLDLDSEDPRAVKLVVLDNEVSNLADQDDRLLTELLRDLTEDGGLEALLGTGYDELSLAALVMTTRTRDEIEDFDAAAEWVGLPGMETPDAEPRLLVRFLSAADRDRLMELIGQPDLHYRSGNIWTTWWPSKPRADRVSVKFDTQGSAGVELGNTTG